MRGYTIKRSPYPSAGNKKGSVLVLALWALTLLTVFSSLLAYGVRQKLSVVYRLDDRSSLRYIAEAGVKRAMARVKEITGEKASYAVKDGGNDPEIFDSVTVGKGFFSVYRDVQPGKGKDKTRFYGFSDEESRININTAPADVMKKLFTELGLHEGAARDLASSIVDWRDTDSALSEPFGSGEDSYYRSLSAPYEAKDSEISAIDELVLVKDMDANTFDKIKDYVTIYGSGKVNVNTAGEEVLLCTGLSREIVQKILAFRKGEDELEGTEDDNVFESVFSIESSLAAYGGLSDSELALLSTVADMYLGVGSGFFRIKSLGKLPGKKLFMETDCVVTREGSVMYWRETYGSAADVDV